MRNVYPDQVSGFAADGSPEDRETVEPNADIACNWWPDITNVWTPIGWPSHLFRFNVVYDGAIIAHPVVSPVGQLKPHVKPYAGQGVQLTFIPSPSPSLGLGAINLSTHGYAETTFPYAGRAPQLGNQGWNETPAPLLWSEWRREGLVLRQEIFAHVPGGGEVETGIEPLFCWIRLSIHDVADQNPFKTYGFLIILNASHTLSGAGGILHVNPKQLAYPRELRMDAAGDEEGRGFRLVEPDGRIRLAVVGVQSCNIRFLPKDESDPSNLLFVDMPSEKGASVDLLLPFLPTEPVDFDAEINLGYDRALVESNRNWSEVPATAAEIVTPEKLVNDTIEHSVKFVKLCTETNPTTGQCTFLTGTLNYEQLWPTPTLLYVHMLLDVMGYHDFVAEHLEILKESQGTRMPPGTGRDDPEDAVNYYDYHPGYYGAPESIAIIDWMSDHGAVLHTVSNHALLTDDKDFINLWLDSILKACEFIHDVRANTGHGGVEGLLPLGVDTDTQRQMQSIWADGWSYLGLSTTVRLLKRIGHPRAQEFAEEAEDYKEVFVKVLREHTEKSPVWTDRNGQEHHYVPGAFSGAVPRFDEMIYLAHGPIFLVYTGLMDADDPLMRSSCQFFRERPEVNLYRGYFTDPACLLHETNTCEPCYSWNIFHSHQLGDRPRFLEGMYSLFASGLSRQTYISCEMRGGVTGNVFSAAPAAYLARLSVIDDLLKPDEELHLLRLCPLAWLKEEEQTRFVNMPTTFGPLTLMFQLVENGTSLEVSFVPRFRHKPKRVTLHVPPKAGMSKVIINGKTFQTRPGETLKIV